jgi:hypothetical protein
MLPPGDNAAREATSELVGSGSAGLGVGEIAVRVLAAKGYRCRREVATTRVTFWGALEMAMTARIGTLFGAAM